MTLSRESRLVRFAYCFDYPPYRTSLCAFFWRCFLFVPLMWLAILFVVSVVVFLVGKVVYEHPFAFLVTLGFVLSIVGVVVACETDNVAELEIRIANSVFVQGLKTIKGKFCPIITIK